MRIFYELWIFTLLFSSFNIAVAQQCPTGGAAFINEFSGSSGDEYVELVVIGDPAAPLDPVDLEGWIVDDNNIDQTGQGTASGHLILGSCFNAMSPGSIIVIYNPDFVFPGITPGFPNPDGAYVLPHSDPCITICSSNPNTSDPNYIPCTTTSYESWSSCLGINDDHDGVQVRNPSAIFYHGLYFNTNFGPAGEVGCLEVSGNQSSLDCGDWFAVANYSALTPSPGASNSTLNQVLIDEISAGTLDCANIADACVLFQCPTIASIDFVDAICENTLFDITATGLADMAQIDNTETDFGINFVLFAGTSPPADPYVGGSSLGIVNYADLGGIDPDQSATINTSISTSGDYQICAILEPVSAEQDCSPYACKTITINDKPIASLSGYQLFCPEECHQISAVISGGTEPYDVTFILQVGVINFPFTISSYDVNDQLTICYDGTGLLPSYDAANNTLHFPMIITGSGSLILEQVIDANGCEPENISPDFLTLDFEDSPDINSIDPIEVCDIDGDGFAYFDLESVEGLLTGGTGANVSWYEDADGNVSIPNPDNYLSITATVYASVDDANCPSDTIAVDLIVVTAPFPGEAAEIEICNTDDSILDFNAALGGDPGGSWSDDDGAGVDLSDPSYVDFTGISPGVYHFTYTIPGDAVCPNMSAVITVTVSEPVNPGIDDGLDVCFGSTTLINLYYYLGSDYDAGGFWDDVDGAGVNLSDPGNVDFSSVPVGQYHFVYTVLSSTICMDQSATVLVNIYDEPNPGMDNLIEICNEGNTSTDLEAALGDHDNSGIWVDIDNSGVDLSKPFSVDFSGIDTGYYHYDYAIPETEGCPEASARITVHVGEMLSAGADSTLILCQGSSLLISLFDLIVGEADSTGIWSQLSGSPVDLSNPDSIDLSQSVVGIDTFLYELQSPCGIDSAFAIMIIDSSPSAGDDYTRVICQSIDTINLYDSLFNYIPGGSWYDAGQNQLSDPSSIVFDSSGSFSFSYILPPDNDCQADTAMALIIATSGPYAGADSSLFVCQGLDWIQNLYDLIPGVLDSSGVWTQLSGDSLDISKADSVSFTGLAVGIDSFLYILSSNCGIDSSLAIISIDDSPYAGDNYDITICQATGSISLYDSLLNYNTGGNWYDDDTQFVANPENYVFSNPGNYQFSYVIPQSGTCQADTAEANIAVFQAPNAGQNATILICDGTQGIYNLLNYLDGNPDPGGLWTDLDDSGIDLSDPENVDISTLAFGTYRFQYYLNSTDDMGICAPDSAVLTLSIITTPNAGMDNAITICSDENGNLINLDSLLLGHDVNGEWHDDNLSGLGLTNPFAVNFIGIPPGIYNFSYLIASNASCPSDTATISVELLQSPNVGSDDSFSICEGETAIYDLYSYLENGVSSSGFWEDTNNSGIDVAQANFVDFSSVAPGTYNFEYILSMNTFCGFDTAVITLEILNAPFTGTCDTISICNGPSASPLDFDAILIGNDPGGEFRELTQSGVDISNINSVDFEGVLQGRYIFEYYFPAAGICPEQSTRIYLDVLPASFINLEYEICPAESIEIGGITYNLDNPSGMEYLSNLHGCDSIVSINISQKVISVETEFEDADCFGFASITINNIQGTGLPIFVENASLGLFEILDLPYTIDMVPPGNYVLNFTDSKACRDTESYTITAFDDFSISLVDEVTITEGESYPIDINTDIIPETISWWPETALSCTDCLNPIASPLSDTEYVISIFDAEGCSVTDTILIRVEKDVKVFIPNVFSPNGDDINPTFYAQSNEIDGMYTMTIFNRWGEKLYYAEGLSLNQPNSGWDGQYQGKSLIPGIYVYLIEIALDNGKREIYGGDVLLMR